MHWWFRNGLFSYVRYRKCEILISEWIDVMCASYCASWINGICAPWCDFNPFYVSAVVRLQLLLARHESAASSDASPGWELGVSSDSVLASLGSRQHDHCQASLRPHYCQGRATSRRHRALSTWLKVGRVLPLSSLGHLLVVSHLLVL